MVAGRVSTATGATSNSTCTVCSAGRSSNGTGSATCSDCPGGTSSGAEAGSCTLCVSGTFSAAIAATTCQPCGAGTTSVAGSTGCTSVMDSVTSILVAQHKIVVQVALAAGSAAASSFQCTNSSSSWDGASDSSSTTITVPGLKKFTDYTIRCRAYNAAGYGNEVTITIKTMPDVPNKMPFTLANNIDAIGRDKFNVKFSPPENTDYYGARVPWFHIVLS